MIFKRDAVCVQGRGAGIVAVGVTGHAKNTRCWAPTASTKPCGGVCRNDHISAIVVTAFRTVAKLEAGKAVEHPMV